SPVPGVPPAASTVALIIALITSKVYGEQFTLDQYWDGVDARKFLSTTSDVINAIINATVEAAGGTPGTGEETNPNV
ncbi:phage tail assembly chaperone G, partial [Bacillus sp. SS-TM]